MEALLVGVTLMAPSASSAPTLAGNASVETMWLVRNVHNAEKDIMDSLAVNVSNVLILNLMTA